MLEEKAQGQFCLVTMDVKNTGDSAQTFDAQSSPLRSGFRGNIRRDLTWQALPGLSTH